MNTKRKRTTGGQSAPRLRQRLSLLCAAALLLGLWMPQAKAAVITVKEMVDGTFQTDDTTPVYPITAGQDWTVQAADVGVDVNSYQDGGGNFYAPAGTKVAITLGHTSITTPVLLGTEPVKNNDVPVTAAVRGAQITATIDAMPPGAHLSVNSGEAATNNSGAVTGGVDGLSYYCPVGGTLTDGSTYVLGLPVTITAVDAQPSPAPVIGVPFSGYSGMTDLKESEPPGTYIGTCAPGTTSLAVTVDPTRHIIVSGTSREDGDATPIVMDRTANRAPFTLLGTKPVAVNLVVAPIVTLTAPDAPAQYNILAYQPAFQEASQQAPPPFQLAAGLDVSVLLFPPRGKSFIEGDTSVVTSCAVSGGTPFTMTDLAAVPVDHAIRGTIPGAAIPAGGGVLSITLDPAKLQDDINVIPQEGAGYTLIDGESMGRPPVTELWALLTVAAAYSNSTPVLTAPGCFIELPHPAETDPGTGAMRYRYHITRIDGTFDADLAVTVSGILLNGSGQGSGGGYTPAPPTVRVENELNQGKSSSDTTLWPAGTVERDGVSTTTVTDKELAAMLELARAHNADAEKLEGDGLVEGIILIEDLKPNSEETTSILELTGSQLAELAAAGWDRLTVQTPTGSFSLYPEALAQAGSEITDGAQPVRITLHRLDYQGRPGVDASLTVDKSQVNSFETPYGVRIVVPYTPAPGEDPNALTIDYIHEDGQVEHVTECHYDPEAGGLVFFTTHLSKFGVIYRPAAFRDVGPDHWANPYVTFLTARGVIAGQKGGLYYPDSPATRGEFISLLTRALSAAKLPSKPVQAYADVPASSFVAGASNWLFFNNLAAPLIQNNKLLPNEAITREDMATLLGNVATGMGLRVRSKGLDSAYTDAGSIAPYAKSAVTRLSDAGILEMTANFKFNPKATLNRGEMAQIVATLLSGL